VNKSLTLVLAALSVLLGLLLVEAAGRIFLRLRPAYDVLFLQPDRALGWKQVPALEWTWAGTHWYAKDFSVEIATNSLGFRDRERELAKPAGVERVALLGDSFVEAIQVPLDQTAGQLLEARLNGSGPGPRYEVLNFGISNFGVGQYLLAWETWARRFQPDLVFLFVAEFHLRRTLSRFEMGRFHHTSDRALWIRPTFRLEAGALVREPAAEYDAFVAAQRELMEREFAGGRSRRRANSFLPQLLREWRLRFGSGGAALAGPPRQEIDPATIELNLRIIQELGRQVEAQDGRLILVDANAYFDGSERLSEVLRSACRQQGLGYVPLAERLLAADQEGQATRWPSDGHFNPAGNQVFADALYEWIRGQSPAAPNPD
jgi:lysophospholipase L1-like esterase